MVAGGKSIKFFTSAALFSVTALLAGASSANYSGMCIPSTSWLSEEDALATARVRAFNSALAASRALERDGIEVERVDYASQSDFDQRNPGCCRLSQEGPMELTLSTWGKITGQSLAFVRLEYVSSSRSGPEKRTDHYIITNCGRLRNVID